MLRYKTQDCYIHRKIIDYDLLVPILHHGAKNNGIILLNETAVFLWNEIQTEKTVDELCKALSEEYGIKHEDVVDDVMQFIDDMLSFDAIVGS